MFSFAQSVRYLSERKIAFHEFRLRGVSAARAECQMSYAGIKFIVELCGTRVAGVEEANLSFVIGMTYWAVNLLYHGSYHRCQTPVLRATFNILGGLPSTLCCVSARL